MKGFVNIQGKILPIHQAVIPVLDHGFLYGDSVYETFRTCHGTPLQFEEHIDRLFYSAQRLELKMPFPKEKILQETLNTALHYWKKTKKEDLYIRVIVSRGYGDIGFDPKLCPHPLLIIIVKPFIPFPQIYYKTGVKLTFVSIVRNHPKSIDPNIKSGNYLNNILAYLEAKKQGSSIFDALMCNADGCITEGTTSNIFIIKKGKLYTPSLESGILRGLTREFIIRLAKNNHLNVQETKISKAMLLSSDECFLASSLKGILPVTYCKTQTLRKIGSGKPGPMTQKLMSLFDHAITKTCASSSS